MHYRISQVFRGDRHHDGWAKEAFFRHLVAVERAFLVRNGHHQSCVFFAAFSSSDDNREMVGDVYKMEWDFLSWAGSCFCACLFAILRILLGVTNRVAEAAWVFVVYITEVSDNNAQSWIHLLSLLWILLMSPQKRHCRKGRCIFRWRFRKRECKDSTAETHLATGTISFSFLHPFGVRKSRGLTPSGKKKHCWLHSDTDGDGSIKFQSKSNNPETIFRPGLFGCVNWVVTSLAGPFFYVPGLGVERHRGWRPAYFPRWLVLDR